MSYESENGFFEEEEFQGDGIHVGEIARFHIWYKRNSAVQREAWLALEAQAKMDMERLREEITEVEKANDVLYISKIRHEMAALVRRKNMTEEKDVLAEYERAFDDLLTCENPDFFLTLNFALCEAREALEREDHE